MKKTTFTQLAMMISLMGLLFACGPENESAKATAEEASTSIKDSDVETKKTILFFGNSLTAGYGLDSEDAFPALVQQRIDSLGLDYRVINGGLSGETTAGGLNRLDWFLEDEPYVFVLELGGNDGLRGIAISETRSNLEKIIEKVQTKYPSTKIILAGMQIPPNMGQEYTDEFRKIYPKVASEKNITLIPFLLEGVAGDPELNLPDGIHPTEEGHEIVFGTVWPYIEKVIR
ncbi:MAG: arylesterase [Bacteroidota bacterium]